MRISGIFRTSHQLYTGIHVYMAEAHHCTLLFLLIERDSSIRASSGADVPRCRVYQRQSDEARRLREAS